MKKFKMMAGVMALVVAAVSMTACGNGTGDSETDADKSAVNSELPVDATKENVDYAETTVATEAVETTTAEDTTSVEETTATETTTETTTVETSGGNANSGDGNSGSASGGGENTPIEFDVKSSNVCNNTPLNCFTVFDGQTRDSYNVSAGSNEWKSYDDFVSELNRRENFSVIDGEKYSGSLAEVLGFDGQAYWLRGEGNSKIYIEQNDEDEITAIAFSDLKKGYEMMLSTSPVMITDDSECLGGFIQSACSASNAPYQHNCDNSYMTFICDGIWCAVFEVDTSFSDPAHNNDEYIRGIMICRRDRLYDYVNIKSE